MATVLLEGVGGGGFRVFFGFLRVFVVVFLWMARRARQFSGQLAGFVIVM